MGLHNIKVIVIDGGKRSYSSTKTSNNNEKTNYKDSPLYKALNARETITEKVQSGMSPATVFAMNMGVKVASQLVTQTANYYISNIGRKYGDSNYQSMVNRQIEMVTDPLSIVGGAVSGSATGSMFGFAGAIVGAVIGAASSAISLGFKYSERERDYQFRRFQDSNNQAYNISRANFTIQTGRVR